MTSLAARLICFTVVIAAFSGVGVSSTLAASPGQSGAKAATPPKEARVLFDGSSLDAWASQKNRQWEDSDGPADWRITSEGWLEVVPGAGSLISKERFGDFHLHLEFRLPKGDINGGVFLMGRYELGISASEDQGSRCGGFDNLRERISPLVRADREPGQWQTFDVDFRAPRFDAKGSVAENARASVVFNGVLIHDNVELGPRRGAAKRLGDAEDGILMLQEHGATYHFRNIWLVDRSTSPD